MNAHYHDDAIHEYVEGKSANAAQIEAHAASCVSCSVEIATQRRMIAALEDRTSWQAPQDAGAPSGARLAALVAFKERIDAEDAEAASRVASILQRPSAWWRNAVRQDPAVRTAGTVRHLLAKMRETLERVPSEALLMTSLATDIAEGLSVAKYPSDFVVALRAQALRDHAFVLSYIGRFSEARAAADRAERLFRQTPVPDYELARLDLVRANICRGIERFDESVALARHAAEVFLRFGDRHAAVNARINEGATLFELRDYASALEVWKAIEHDPGLTSDTQRIGLLHNLGICYRETSQLEKAAEYLARAAAEFELVGNDTNRVRSRWGLATTLSAAARHEQAIPLLREVWREFESLGLEADAALVALELAESLLVTNRPDEVPAICRTLLDRFTQSGMSERAVVALAFLRESVASGHATPVHVRHVHDFLRDIPVEGERLFAPPPLNTL